MSHDERSGTGTSRKRASGQGSLSRHRGCRVLLTRRERLLRPAWLPIKKTLQKLLSDHNIEGTLSVVFVTDSEIQNVHAEFLGEDRPTDVLSFPLLTPDEAPVVDRETVFGEVVVSAETALREAKNRRLPASREAALYVIHGTLHLVGFDDHSSPDRRRMRRAERHYVDLYRALGGD